MRVFGLCEELPRDGDGEEGGIARLKAFLLLAWDTLAMGNYPYASNYLVFQQTNDPAVS